MNGVHTVWTPPKGGAVFKTDYELLTAVLSALEWRKHNGKIIMFTDNTEYFEKSGLSPVWDRIVRLDIKSSPDPYTFWAAGKIYAMKKMNTPFCMLDTDFIVWKKINFDKIRLSAIHEEELSMHVYPDYKSFFENSDYNSLIKPVNTAFTYINDAEFLRLYTTEAISFMKSFPKTDDKLCPMVFAEQRMFSMCADKLGIDIHIMSNLKSLFENGADGRFTHLWGFKRQMDENNVLRYDYRKRILSRIEKEFSEYSEITKRGLSYDI